MKLENLKKLYVHELKDLYSAETQILDAMPKMIENVTDPELRKAFEDHRSETKGQVRRLEKIFSGLDFKPEGHKCKGMEGLIKEGEGLIKSQSEPEVLDVALISASQRIEHYEMAAYGTARAMAEKLGYQEAADLLSKTLEEEGKADRTLTRLAERRLNFEAMVA